MMMIGLPFNRDGEGEDRNTTVLSNDKSTNEICGERINLSI